MTVHVTDIKVTCTDYTSEFTYSGSDHNLQVAIRLGRRKVLQSEDATGPMDTKEDRVFSYDIDLLFLYRYEHHTTIMARDSAWGLATPQHKPQLNDFCYLPSTSRSYCKEWRDPPI